MIRAAAACLLLSAAAWVAAFQMATAARVDGDLVTFFLELGDATPLLDRAGRAVYRFLHPALLAAITVLVAALAWRRGERARATAAAGTFVVAVAVSQALQPVASTPRSHEELFMEGVRWPSGHAAAVVAMASAVAIAAPRWRGVAFAVAALDCLCIALIHYHFPSDVLGGAALAGACGFAAAAIARRGRTR